MRLSETKSTYTILFVDCDIPGRNRTDIRLAGSNEPASGRVEILVGDQWGTICDVFWGLADAEVVCRDLGYTGALQATGAACKYHVCMLIINQSLPLLIQTLVRVWAQFIVPKCFVKDLNQICSHVHHN